ncbi:hypothetical protein Glove_71g130 [Diversispora epigaea]|uniref:Protein kinase domain-containing protein n=1 Tax=Diversispora epigaea TaxID=1348612 RepID=A0A397JJ43_9GLOM|nr:hypothetical protein Glove_71g130 [Diversispora epigaea]
MVFDEICQCDQKYSKRKYYWCIPCNSTRFKNDFDKWTSGNYIIDKFIQDAQLKANYYDKAIEWIPYNRFRDIKKIAKGSFGTIYYAKWIDGPINSWDIENEKWERFGQHVVALKNFDGIGDINEDFLNEMAIHSRAMETYSSIGFYGITKDPETHKYMMVLEYLKGGSLRNYLNDNFINISWRVKLLYLRDLARNFTEIHELNIIHQDFHPGNILAHNFDESDLYISDFGLSKLIGKNGENLQKRTVFGVLPYIAPEVLCGEEYTKAADVYSFAITAYQIITGLPPYPNVPHDDELALKICNGLRPKIPFHTPKLITKLIMRSWDAQVIYRPTFDILHKVLKKCVNDYLKYTGEITIQIEEAEEFSDNNRYNNCETT